MERRILVECKVRAHPIEARNAMDAKLGIDLVLHGYAALVPARVDVTEALLGRC